METDLQKNREAIPELMRSRWPGVYSEKLIRDIELLMQRMIAREEEGAIHSDFRGIDGVPHLFRAATCLLEIAEEPPEIATMLAILGHDWDRCLVKARVARDLFPRSASGYEAYKTSSAVVSALEFCNNVIPPELFEQSDIQLARERIVFHEKGRDPATDLIDAADCLVFFYVPNLNAYYRSDGEDGLRHKLRYQLPSDSKHLAEVKCCVHEAINSEHLEESIVPILRVFLDFISTSEAKEAMMTSDKKTADTPRGGIDTGGGDFVGRDKTVHGDVVGRDKITVMSTTGVGGQELAQLFEKALQRVEQSNLSPFQKPGVEQALQTVQKEVNAGDEKADLTLLEEALEFIKANAPDILGTLAGVFVHPLVGEGIKRIGNKALGQR